MLTSQLLHLVCQLSKSCMCLPQKLAELLDVLRQSHRDLLQRLEALIVLLQGLLLHLIVFVKPFAGLLKTGSGICKSLVGVVHGFLRFLHVHIAHLSVIETFSMLAAT